MKLYEFNLLNTNEQADAIKSKAAFIGERKEEKYTYKLYQIDDFYIEEKWHTAFNERREVSSFMSITKLQPYLEVMDVTSLLLSVNRTNI
ncbi:MAG TPA: hypothetical protein VHB70_13430 [Parafilimonas sp.]|nr:hypothetical protein [Parafilimonas sp.]